MQDPYATRSSSRTEEQGEEEFEAQMWHQDAWSATGALLMLPHMDLRKVTALATTGQTGSGHGVPILGLTPVVICGFPRQAGTAGVPPAARRRRRGGGAVWVLACCLLQATTTAGEPLIGRVVLDRDGEPVPSVEVQLVDPSENVVATGVTDRRGLFVLDPAVQSAVGDVVSTASMPSVPSLGHAYPNPFNPSVRIPFHLPYTTRVDVAVYNSGGQRVRTLQRGLQPAGGGEVGWDGRDEAGRGAAAGVYLVRMQTHESTPVIRVTLLDGVASQAPKRAGTAQAPSSSYEGYRLIIRGSGVAPQQVILLEVPETLLIVVHSDVTLSMLPDGGVMTMRGVPAGSFPMGSERYDDERPPRSVFLDGFYLAELEVTVSKYAACVSAGVCAPAASGSTCNDTAGPAHPANCVSWYDAGDFCAWAGMRLPTEAEWEKAARGSEGRVYPWGRTSPEGAGDCERAVMMAAGVGLGCGHDGTAPVGGRPAGTGPYGHLDLAGNVWEWTADAFERDYYRRSPPENPVNDGPATQRVVRGNSWYYSDPNPDMRAANRFGFRPLRWVPYVGFRCAAAADRGATHDYLLDPGPAERVALTLSDWMARNQLAMAAEGDTLPRRDPPARDDMVNVPAGSFRMGSTLGDSDESPVHEVVIDAFEIDRHEVTVAHYRECVVEGACREPHSGSAAYRIEAEAYYLNWGQPGRDAHPVNGVSWYDANNFCLWASKRLPTEAEWEWSARGDDGRRYPWGNEEATCKRAIIDDGGDGCGHEMAWPVGSRVSGASSFGVLDQAGNLWEWMADWYDRQYYHRSAVHNPHNEEEGEGLKVLRGGSMADQNPHVHRLTNRLGYDPRQRFDYTVGFRCARDLPQ